MKPIKVIFGKESSFILWIWVIKIIRQIRRTTCLSLTIITNKIEMKTIILKAKPNKKTSLCKIALKTFINKGHTQIIDQIILIKQKTKTSELLKHRSFHLNHLNSLKNFKLIIRKNHKINIKRNNLHLKKIKEMKKSNSTIISLNR